MRLLMPDVLAEAEQIRKELPQTLKTIDNASSAVTETTREIRAIRPLVPDVLHEVGAVRQEIAATRSMIPTTLDRLDGIVHKAGVAGQKASEGAISGVFTGIIKAPFKALGSIGRASGGKSPLGDEDIRKATDAVHTLTQLEVGSSEVWENPSTGYNGKLTLLKRYEENTLECQLLSHQVWKGKKPAFEKQLDICRRSPAAQWELKEDM